VDIADLKEILRILEERDITEFELEQDGVKLRVCRRTGAAPLPADPVIAPLAPAPGPSSAGTPGPAPANSHPGPEPPATGIPGPQPEDGATVVKSPIVGTFYRAPDPNAAPFVSVGDRVKVGQVLCIIEAMKLMNEIEAEVAGEILRVHPENGQPVQYGDPLFTVRPA
jgi:acetyl-CoA carboxylase biotin carboxyl carrier protein